MKQFELQKKAEEALYSCFKDIPFVELGNLRSKLALLGGKRANIELPIKIQNKEKILIGEIKSKGQPRLARNAINQLKVYIELIPDSYGIFIAPYISEATAKICKQAGIGYLDFAGNCFMSFANIYIMRDGFPNPSPDRRELNSLYSPKAERILRVLLEVGPKKWKTQELANTANVSIGLVSKVKKLLEDREWIESKKIGFELINSMDLLKEWGANYKINRSDSISYYSLMSTGELEKEISRICNNENINYAFSGFSAAANYAPMVRYQQVTVYVRDKMDVELLSSKLEWKNITSGANVNVLIPYDNGVFYQSLLNTEFVSPIQAYLDLIKNKGRGEEAAEAILREVIEKKWQ